MLVVERHHSVIEDLGRGDRGLAVIELGEGDFGIGVDEGLLIDPPDPLQGADIEGVLSATIAGAFAVELAVRLLVGFGLLESGDLGFGQQDAILRQLGFSALRRCLIEVRSWRCHTQRTPAGEIDRPCRFRASDTRTWPQAGCSIASATAACSISIGVRFFNTGLRRLISCSASSPPLSYSSLNR